MNPPASPARAVPAAPWLDATYEPGLVSVIVPAYNRRGLIAATLASLGAQTWPNLEIVVVDDGSTDGTAEVVAGWTPPVEGHRLRLLRQENAGASAARNAGTRAARGEFLIYLDSDDELFPEAIHRYVDALESEGAGYCVAPIDVTDEAGRLGADRRRYYPRCDAADLIFDCFWLVHGACYRREVLRRAGPWDTRLRRAEDHEFLWRIKAAAGRPCCLDTVQGRYRQHSRDQLHLQLSRADFFRVRVESIGYFVAWLEREGRLDRAMRVQVASQCRFLAMRLAIAGDFAARNRALDLIRTLLAGEWHPLRWAFLLRWLPAPRWLDRLAQFRFRGADRPEPAPAADGPSQLLFLSPVAPDPEGLGPARRAAAVIEALSRYHQVTLLIVGSPRYERRRQPDAAYLGGRWRFLAHQPSRRESWHRGFERRWPRLYRRLVARPVQWCEITGRRREAAAAVYDGRHFDLVHAFRLSMAPYALSCAARLPAGTPLHLDLDDIDSRCNRRIAAVMRRNGEKGPARAGERLAQDLTRAERLYLPRFDRVYVASETDRHRLGVPVREVRVLPNIAPAPRAPTERPAPGGPFCILYVGLLRYYPNADALHWFCREVMPRVRAACDCRLMVGGRGLLEETRAIIAGTAGVEYFGEFATTADGFAQGDALVVPLRAGGGTRLKILEAFAHGCPVVTTAIGIEGIEAEPGCHYLAAEAADDFVRQIARLARDAGLGRRLAAEARELWQREYSPERLVRALAPDGSGG